MALRLLCCETRRFLSAARSVHTVRKSSQFHRSLSTARHESLLWRTHNNAGLEAFHAGRFPQALRLFQQALHEQAEQGENICYATSLSNSASCLRRMGRRIDAEDAYKAAIRILQQLPAADAIDARHHLYRTCLDYGRMLEQQSESSMHSKFGGELKPLQFLARAVATYRHPLVLPGEALAPVDAIDARQHAQDQARSLFALASCQYRLAQAVAPPKEGLALEEDTALDAAAPSAAEGESKAGEFPGIEPALADKLKNFERALDDAWQHTQAGGTAGPLPVLPASTAAVDAAADTDRPFSLAPPPAEWAVLLTPVYPSPFPSPSTASDPPGPIMSASEVEAACVAAVSQPRATAAQRTSLAHHLLRAAQAHMHGAVITATAGFGDHVQTAEALSSLAALEAALSEIDAQPHVALQRMRVHFANCLEMLYRLNETERFSLVLTDFTTLCIQAGMDTAQLRGLMDLLQVMKTRTPKGK